MEEETKDGEKGGQMSRHRGGQAEVPPMWLPPYGLTYLPGEASPGPAFRELIQRGWLWLPKPN